MRTLFFSGLVLLLTGLAAPTVAQDFQPFGTPVGETFTATTGERVLTEGQYELRDAFTLNSPIRSTMPGSMGIPFGFSIQPGELVFSGANGDWEYFCSDLRRASASFPGLGSVVAEGDCVGIRRRLRTMRLEWTVDNSNHNGMNTVWSRAVRDNELGMLVVTQRQVVSDVAVQKAVFFDGYYSGLLNFTYVDGNQRREMKFDYDGSGEKMIGMVGRRMLVLSADSVEIRYRWVN